MAGVSDVDLLGEDDNLSSQPDEESGSSPWSMSGHLKDQSERLFALDSSLRVRVPFTSIECDKLRGRLGPHFSDGQVSLAIACIGLPDGRAATKNLWAKELELQGLKWMAGEACGGCGLPRFWMPVISLWPNPCCSAPGHCNLTGQR